MTAQPRHLHVVSPVTDEDAHAVITAALEAASGRTTWIGSRDYELTHQGSVFTDAIHVTVWDANEYDEAPGVDYAVTITRLAYCDTHHRHFRSADRICDLCVIDQTTGDE